MQSAEHTAHKQLARTPLALRRRRAGCPLRALPSPSLSLASAAAALALDVEYVHHRRLKAVRAELGSEQVSEPAWVALVDSRGRCVLKTHCLPEGLQRLTGSAEAVDAAAATQRGVVWMGGVTLDVVLAASPLGDVREQLRRLLASTPDAVLVGHGLKKVRCSGRVVQRAQVAVAIAQACPLARHAGFGCPGLGSTGPAAHH